MSNIKDIETMIAGLSATEIRKIMSEVKAKKPKSVDTSRKLRRMAITQLYFDNAPRPKGDFEAYLNHSDGIREQIISGVDAWK